MQKVIKIFGLCAITVLFASCFKVDETTVYGELAPIELSVVSDTINVNIGEELVYTGLTVKSELPVSYKWVYGMPQNGSSSSTSFEQKELISTTENINYTFTKVGSYLLRLELDNSESIVFKYFTLNVNSGYDEGVAVLSNSSDGTAHVSFLKTQTSAETAAGEQRFFYDIFENMQMHQGVDMYISDGTISLKDKEGSKYTIDTGTWLVGCADEDGSIYHFDAKTCELFTTVKASESMGEGVHVKSFGGEYAATGGFADYLLGSDGRCWRYDLQMGNLTLLTDLEELGLPTHAVIARYRQYNSSTSKTVAEAWYYDEGTVYVRRSSYPGAKAYSHPGWRVVNVGVKRIGSDPTYTLFQKIAEPDSIYVLNSSASSLGRKSMKEPVGMKVSRLCMDSDSKIINTYSSSDVYYTYDNAIYRWGLVSAPNTTPAITLPDGEIIRDIDTNFKGKAADAGGEDLLYVVTYNPTRSTEHKGSLYVYSFADNSLVESYEGVFDDPVKVMYKYRIN